MANTWISRAATGSVTSSTTFTFSFWIKRATLSSTQYFFIHENASGHTQKLELLFQTDNTIRMGWYDGSSEYNYDTEMLFRDTSAWYNFVFRYDTTQSTDSNRVRMYVNGEQISYLNANGSSPTYMTQNKAMNLGQKVMAHGRYQSSNPGNYLTGSLSHIHYCDGQSYAPTSFGETDSTTGEWKIKANPSLTYGNNGYFILKDGNSVTNQAGNSSGNFSVSGGTLTKTEDNPSNVFATMNPLVTYGTNQNALSEGNNTTTGIAYHRPSPPTLAVNKGKWYFEAKALSGTASKWWIGLCDTEYDTNNQGTVGSTANYIWGYDATTNAVNQRSQAIYDVNLRDGGGNISISNIFSAPSADDIYAMAVDLDNQKVWYAKNGVWNNGSASQSTTFNASYPDSTNIDADRFYYIGVGSENSKWSVNYGNGYFGTTAVSSAGTNASGIGIFEYDVPTGYTALSTKGLNL